MKAVVGDDTVGRFFKSFDPVLGAVQIGKSGQHTITLKATKLFAAN